MMTAPDGCSEESPVATKMEPDPPPAAAERAVRTEIIPDVPEKPDVERASPLARRMSPPGESAPVEAPAEILTGAPAATEEPACRLTAPADAAPESPD